MTKKKVVLIAGACVLAAVCAAGIYFAPQIRSVVSIAKGATMDEQARAEMEEENRRLEQELRDKYDVPEGEVNEEINSGVLDGTLTLEEAARQWLEQNGEMDLSQVGGGADASPSDGGADAEASLSGGGSGSSVTENTVDAAAEDAQKAAEQKAAEDAQKAAEQKAAEDAQKAAEQKAAEDAQKAAEQKAAEDAQKAAEQKAAEDAKKAAEQKAAEDAKKAAERKAAEEAQKTAEQKAAEEAAAKEAAAKAEKDAKIQNLVAQAQVLRSVFLAKLDGVVASCKSEFMNLPAEEQTTANKVKIVTGRLGEVADMEEECDAQVASIVSQLQELDADTAAAVKDQYEREKLAKKTSLLNEYRNGPAN